MRPGLRLTRLTLSQFRSYAALDWRPAADVVVMTGPNGAGKTNLLEAISLLAPGRGLRGTRIAEVIRQGQTAWAVHGRFETPGGEMEIGTGTVPEAASDRRIFRLDGVAPRNQAELGARYACVWLTPQMDRLFQEGASGRRRFLDRLVYAFEPSHAREVAAYEAAMAGRNRLLAEGRGDRVWLAGLEDSMARHAVAVSAARAALVARMNAAPAAGAFPAALLGLACEIGQHLAAHPAVETEDWLRGVLQANRGADAAAGSARQGAHRADLTMADAATGLAAAQASTGQQKALLLGMILGHAGLLSAARGFAPLLLLDEPLVHLDATRRDALFDTLLRLPAQSFLTGTDSGPFLALRGAAAGFMVQPGGDLRADPALGP